jgi:nucleotide-binding universal stress UspA family protein
VEPSLAQRTLVDRRPILVAMDAGIWPSCAAREAARLGRSLDAPLVIAHALPRPATFFGDVLTSIRHALIRARARRSGVEIANASVVVEYGAMEEVLAATADQVGARMIVLGSTGTARDAHRAWLFARMGHSVLLARPGRGFEHVIASISAPHADGNVIAAAVELTRELGAALQAVYVTMDFDEVERAARSMARARRASGTLFSTMVLTGHPAERLIGTAQESKADLIVLGQPADPWNDRFLATVTGLRCSVLVVPAGAPPPFAPMVS